MQTASPSELKRLLNLDCFVAGPSRSTFNNPVSVQISHGWWNPNRFFGSCPRTRRIKGKAKIVLTVVCYTRSPIEPAGAYLLVVGGLTGEGFSLWGKSICGFLAPSKKVVHWKSQRHSVFCDETDDDTTDERNTRAPYWVERKRFYSYSKTERKNKYHHRDDIISKISGLGMSARRTRRHRLSSTNDFFSRRSFAVLGCCDYMISSLKLLGIERPAHIQALAFGPVMDGRSCVISDRSGSGKTLAYLIPVIQRLKREADDGRSSSSPGRPRAVVVVPTAELASQVLRVCRSLSNSGAPFQSLAATGGFGQRGQSECLDRGIDVLVVTPGRFLSLLSEHHLGLSDLRCAVVDEADILFRDEEFGGAMEKLIASSSVTTQYLFVTATLPTEAYNKLVEKFPDLEMVVGPGAHRVSPHLEEILVDCSADGVEHTTDMTFENKRSALLDLVERCPVQRTIVFCNRITTCRKVENALRRSDRKEERVRVLPFHSALEKGTRVASIDEFLRSEVAASRRLFLVCTDRASRGIDFVGVDHVVLFDFPRDPSEYVRRVGRTARGTATAGKAFMFVVGKQVSVCRSIIRRNRKGHPLHRVPLI